MSEVPEEQDEARRWPLAVAPPSTVAAAWPWLQSFVDDDTFIDGRDWRLARELFLGAFEPLPSRTMQMWVQPTRALRSGTWFTVSLPVWVDGRAALIDRSSAVVIREEPLRVYAPGQAAFARSMADLYASEGEEDDAA